MKLCGRYVHRKTMSSLLARLFLTDIVYSIICHCLCRYEYIMSVIKFDNCLNF